VKKLLLVLPAAVAACLLAAAQAESDPVWSGQCGIAAKQTIWADYGWPSLLPILARHGTVLAVTNNPGSDYPAEARKRGAATFAFNVHMKNMTGTPAAPADPSSIEAAAQNQYQSAVARMGGCPTPLIVENELFGAANVTPWSGKYETYRSDVLSFLQDLAALGAHPALLVARSPYLGSSDAVNWWLQVSKVADVVREDYVPAPGIWKLGPVLGNRFLRERYRQAIADFTSIGIPANRLGIMISVLSAKGGGGRSDLEPASAWYQVVKWYALSAKEVAHETGLGSVFSWGWQEWTQKEVDPDKPKAACVWLWARDASLCNAPKKLGRSFDASRTEGQIVLAKGVVCRAPRFGSIATGEVNRLAAATGDRNAALSALFERLVASGFSSVSQSAARAAVKTVIERSFGGSRGRYVTALQQAHASPALARAVLGDEIRRARIEQTLRVATPKAREISAFYSAYPQLSVRLLEVSPQAPWLGGVHKGYALSGVAPAQVFTAPGRRTREIRTLLGTYAVKPIGASRPLGSLSLAAATPAIRAALESFERAQAFQQWLVAQERAALRTTTCRDDDLPQVAEVDLTQYLPFLALQ
jgi:hypothetical protein